MDRKPELTDCPRCKGSGKITLHVTTIAVGAKPAEETSRIPCRDCHGSGKVTPEEAERIRSFIEAYKEIWCRCGNPSGQVDFYDDGEHPEISKHHYRCRDCGKVTQIG
jgi:RecJ-like exonuclease